MGDTVEVVVGLDVGTTSAKFVALDRTAAIRATITSDEIPTAVPAPGASVQRPADIWHAVCSACRGGMQQLPPDVRVASLAAAAQSGSVLPIVGGAGAEAITWMDMRSRPVVDGWSETTIASIRATTGWTPMAGLGLTTISWLRRSWPELAIDRLASVDDYVLHELTGRWLTNPSNAAGMQLMDVASLDWSPELCERAGASPSQLSDIVPSGSRAGPVTAAAGTTTGIPEGTGIAVGGHDQSCAALALGAIERGDAVLSMGTAWVLTIVVDAPERWSLPDDFNLSHHVVPGRWTISRNLGGLGAAIAAHLSSGSPAGHPGDVGRGFFIPATHEADRVEWGRFTDPTAGASDRLTAVMESCAFEVRRAIEDASVAGTPRSLTVVGGGTQSDELLRRVADATSLPLAVRPDASWPAIGAALLAARSCDWSIEPPTDLPTRAVEPNPALHEATALRYAEYRRRTEGGSR